MFSVTERHAQLLAVEVHVLGVADVHPRARIHVQEAFHLPAADDVGGDDLLHVVRPDRSVERVVRDDLDDGAFFAESEAARHQHVHLVGDAVLRERGPEILHDPCTFGGLATGAAAAEDLQVRRPLLQTAGFLRGRSVAGLPDGKRLGGLPSDVRKDIR